MTSRCNGLFGALLGHNFIAVYDSIPPVSSKATGFLFFPDDQLRMAEQLTKKVFREMRCTRCGRETAASMHEGGGKTP